MILFSLVLALAQAPSAPPGDFLKPFDTVKEEGRATLSCVFTEQMTVTDCQVLEETPPGTGVGAAAVELAKKFKFKQPNGLKGSPAGMRVKIPLRFELPPAADTTTPDPTPR